MRHFPVFLDLSGHRIAVAGGGDAAVAKLRLLLKTEARIVVFAPDAGETVRRWADSGRLELVARAPEPADLADARLVYAASDDDVEDRRVRDLARAAGVLVCAVDNLDASDFITPAIVDRDPVTVAIGTEGSAPVLARRIKADIETLLHPALGRLARIARRFRGLAAEIPAGAARRAAWGRFFDGDGLKALLASGEAGAESALESILRAAASRESAPQSGLPGRVVLAGAGPGDPELLTLKARKALHEADVVLYDRLTDPRILDLARREAELIEVGKTPGGPSMQQDEINALMIARARAGQQVLRLKSGDPMVFGRADEEIGALSDAGIPCDVIPGITSAVAAAAALGRSLTRRGRNSRITFLTGHDVKGYAEHDWKALARSDHAAAIYMGVRASRFVRGRLLLHGAHPETPVTVVENASRPDQRIVATTLSHLPDALEADDIRGPAIIFLGIDNARAAGTLTPPADTEPPARLVEKRRA